jgi:hypothetical protein
MPFFTSDQLPHYAHALLQVYGIPEVILHIPGKRGPKPTPQRLPPTDLHYAQVVKHRKGGRLVEVTTKIIFGSEAAVQAHLAVTDCNRNRPGLQSARFWDHIHCLYHPTQDHIICL